MRANHFLAVLSFLVIMLSSCNNPKKAGASSDAGDAITETAPASGIAITDKKWKLIELMGQPVADTINGKEPFIIFNKADSSYSANGGCNGLGGKFVLDESTLRIRFSQGMSTMMACPDMSVEDGLKSVFTSADNYTVNDSMLSLNKARMAPLARFRILE